MKLKLKSLLMLVIALSIVSTGALAQDMSGKVFNVKKVITPESTENLVEVSKPALDFIIEVDGKDVKFSEFTKNKIVFLNFWGTWCPPCRREIPDIIQLQKEMKKDVVVVGVASERSAKDKPKVEAFAKKQGINYVNIMNNKEISAYYGKIAYKVPAIQSVPTTFLIDKDGLVRSYKPGMHTKQQFMDWINTVK